jgi:predicted RNase H-like HicB family nuclease
MLSWKPQNPKGTNMTPIEAERTEPVYEVEGWNHDETHRLIVSIFKEEDDEDFTAIALNLPGASGCGESHDVALSSLKESAIGLIRAYKSHGEMIPWEPVDHEAIADQKDHSQKVILLDV